MSDPVVAAFNVHGGVDGWGRPFDVADACRRIDADVLVLAEAWRPEDGPAVADAVAAELGYEVHTMAMAPARLHAPRLGADSRWGPPRRRRRGAGLRASRSAAARPAGPLLPKRPPAPATPGTIELAMLSRLPVRQVDTVDLGRMLGDLTHRGAIVAELDTGKGPLHVAGTHMSHLRHGSIVQLLRLRHALRSYATPTVLLGDMNLWGPPLLALFPGWRRAVRGRTWPSWRPLAQIDHILLSPGVVGMDAEILRLGRSDHLPVRATLRLG